MGKLKQENRKEIEHFKGIIREQKAIIRSLQRRLRDLEKREHGTKKEKYREQEESQDNICENCGKGELVVKDFRFVKYIVCLLCEFKEKY